MTNRVLLFFLLSFFLAAGLPVRPAFAAYRDSTMAASKEQVKKQMKQELKKNLNGWSFDKDTDDDKSKNSSSLWPFLLCLAMLFALRKTLRQEGKQEKWETPIKQAIGIVIIMLALDWTFSIHLYIQYAWHLSLLYFAYKLHTEPDFKTRKPLAVAMLPYAAVGLVRDVAITVSSKFYFDKLDGWMDTAAMLAVVWFFAMLIQFNRQQKTLAKEREKRRMEDEMNKAIAARKVQLEDEVAERTAQLVKQKEELEIALGELKATQDQLIQQEKLASLGELTAGIAHEIQNPLNFVNNFSEVSIELLDELETEIRNNDVEEVIAIATDIKQNLRKINEHGKRADGIVKGMLQHSRKSTGQKEPTDLNALADEYLRLSYHGLRAKDKTFNAILKTEYAEGLPDVPAIPQELGRVLLNMFNNSFYSVSQKKKDAPAGYEPTVSVRTEAINMADGDRGVKITIRDNGTGIPQRVLDKIYQPFFTTKPAGEGTGLGLSLSYDIVTKVHGGELKVDTAEGEYAQFEIVLPV